MKIEKNKVVSMHYTLRDQQGTVVDQSQDDGPLSFIQGIGNIIPGLERQMEGKTTGDKFKATITPDDGYGEVRKELIGMVPRNQFENANELEVGMVFEVSNEQGHQLARIIELTADSVKLDANHPMAGQTLFFEIEIINVREAHPTELAHGHVHQGGGHHH